MRFVLLIIVVYLAYRVVKSWIDRTLPASGPANTNLPPIDDVMVKDPVCGVYFPRREAVELHRDGKTHRFCSPVCRDRFVENGGGEDG